MSFSGVGHSERVRIRNIFTFASLTMPVMRRKEGDMYEGINHHRGLPVGTCIDNHSYRNDGSDCREGLFQDDLEVVYPEQRLLTSKERGSTTDLLFLLL